MRSRGRGGGEGAGSFQHVDIKEITNIHARLEADIKGMDMKIQKRFDEIVTDINIKHERMCEKMDSTGSV